MTTPEETAESTIEVKYKSMYGVKRTTQQCIELKEHGHVFNERTGEMKVRLRERRDTECDVCVRRSPRVWRCAYGYGVCTSTCAPAGSPDLWARGTAGRRGWARVVGRPRRALYIYVKTQYTVGLDHNA